MDRWATDSSEDDKPVNRKRKLVERERKEREPEKGNRNVREKRAGCRSVFCFEKIGRTGEGTYGVVFKARDKETGRVMALKQVKISPELNQEGFPLTTLREIGVLLTLEHENIVTIKEIVVEDLELQRDGLPFRAYMVMDFWDHELKHLLTTIKQPFRLPHTKNIMIQLLSGLDCIHRHWYMHRDLKPANILYRNDGTVAICDFGLARQYKEPAEKYTELVVTLHYRAPELLLGSSRYSSAVDIWSMGCIMGELVLGQPLFYAESEIDQLGVIFKALGYPRETDWPGIEDLPGWKALKLKHRHGPKHDTEQQTPTKNPLRNRFPRTSVIGEICVSDKGIDLMTRMLELNPGKRITASQALEHPWFEEFPPPSSNKDMPSFSVNDKSHVAPSTSTTSSMRAYDT